MENIANRNAGEYISRLSNDSNVVKQCILDIVPQLLQQGLVFLTIIPVLFIINPLMALLILIPAPLIVLGFYFIRSYIRRIYHRQWQASTESSNVLHDIFQGIRIVKAFGMESAEEKRYCEASTKQARIEEQNEKMWNMLFPVINFFMSAGEYVVRAFVGFKVLSGDMTIGDISKLSSYVGLVYGPLRWMSMVPRQLSRALTSAFKLYEDLLSVHDEDFNTIELLTI
jgi:ATP-binding cassette subfamily B protein